MYRVNYTYYGPWGMILNGRSSNFGFADDKYKFTGKERDDETGFDYFPPGRTYDSRVPHWLQIDPLADKYPGWSPYNYALNNPLRFIDPKGMEAVDATPNDPDDPDKKNKSNPVFGKQNQESKTITGDEIKIGTKTVGEVTTEVSARSSKLITSVDNNMPTFLDGTAFALAPLSFGVSAAIGLAAGLWTLKNDSKDGNYNNSAISFITMVLSGSVESPYLKLGIQGFQVFYDLNGPIQNTNYSESLINEIRGTNDQLKKYYELGQIGY